MRDAETNLKYLKNTYEQPFTGKVDVKELQAFKDKFVAAMDEDFNAANGITVVFEMAKWINSGNYDESVKQALADMLEVFGIILLRKFWTLRSNPWFKNAKKRVPIVTLRQLTKSVTN